MDAVDKTLSPRDVDAHDALRRDPATIALWHALDMNRQARDERTERLRTMRLVCGEDERA
ncbi:hypothetical protein MKK63_28730 [Methylobacterium sp. J-088]|uniref:hypothetical protein n=1 Tax=unclassified Methylobacterium TaxID=2615210 RepID=UPI001FBABCC5|nr:MULTISPECIES: hypothetical protein [unclassified Methylobacterium]MCJ2066648.1 hypothetical protein [Methylobacterium sp. J-088]